MDESLLELENELKRLRPRASSAGLQAAVARELGEPKTGAAEAAPRRYSSATSLRSWKWASWTLAGAAAAALVFAAYTAREDKVPPPVPVEKIASVETPVVVDPEAVVAATDANRYEPVQATSVLYDLQESAPTVLPDRSEGRQVRYRFVDTYTWKNPRTNASVSWSVPRDEVRLVRANFD